MDKRDIKYLKPKKTILEQVRSGFIKVLLFLFMVPLIFLFLIPGLLGLFFGQDIEAIDDLDLVLEVLSLPREENAFYDLEKIIKIFKEPDALDTLPGLTKYLAGEEGDEEKLAQIIEDNQRSLKYFDDATQKEAFLLPWMANPGEDMETLDSLHSWRLIAQIASLRSLSLLRTGEAEQAFKEALAIIKLGHLIEISQTDPITYLTGLAIKKDGLETMAEVFRKTSVNIYRLPYYYDFLAVYDSQLNTSPLKQEYLLKKKEINEIASGEKKLGLLNGRGDFLVKSDFYFKPNKTISTEAEIFRKIIAYFEAPCYAEISAEEESPLFLNVWSIPKLYFTENVLGKIGDKVGQTALNNVKTKACANQARLAGARLTLAFKEYYVQQGELPESLSNLISGKAWEELKDPFSGIDFEYDKSRKRLYSVGGDHEIDTDDDIIFSLDFSDEAVEPEESN